MRPPTAAGRSRDSGHRRGVSRGLGRVVLVALALLGWMQAPGIGSYDSVIQTSASASSSVLVANLWVDRVAGVDSCLRSPTQVSYEAALAAGSVCLHWDAAYRAASSSAD